MLTRKQTIQVKQALIACGGSQKDLADKMGVTRQYLNALINGKEDNPLQEMRVLNWAATVKENTP